jgi:hypothetical protein
MGEETERQRPERKLEWVKVAATLADAASRVLDLVLRH